MDLYITEIKKAGYRGDINQVDETLSLFSHDGSLFELKPRLVVAPKNSRDVEILVHTAAKLKNKLPELSLTARSGGTCMSGGSIGESVVVNFGKHMTKIEKVSAHSATTEMGVYYRYFEKATLNKGAMLPTFPASREICMLGGMINNNSGGELSLRYGKTEDYIQQLEMVFADGKKRIVKPLNHAELEAKKQQNDFEGEVYRKMYDLIEKNDTKLKMAKPNVSKDSTGYHLWNVLDKQKGTFDLTHAIAGGQGTRLGFDKPKGMYPVGPVSGAFSTPVRRRCMATTRRCLSRRRRHSAHSRRTRRTSWPANTIWISIIANSVCRRLHSGFSIFTGRDRTRHRHTRA